MYKEFKNIYFINMTICTPIFSNIFGVKLWLFVDFSLYLNFSSFVEETFRCTSPPSQRLTYLILFLIPKHILRYNISISDLGSLKTILKTLFCRRPIRIKYCEPFRKNWRVYIFLGDNLTLLNYNQDLRACCLLHKIKVVAMYLFRWSLWNSRSKNF